MKELEISEIFTEVHILVWRHFDAHYIRFLSNQMTVHSHRLEQVIYENEDRLAGCSR